MLRLKCAFGNCWLALISAAAISTCSVSICPRLQAQEMVSNGGFEQGFTGWTRWGRNADLITLNTNAAHQGAHSAQLKPGHNALYFVQPLDPAQAYELRFWYRLAGESPSGQVALNYSKDSGALRSAGVQLLKLAPPARGLSPAPGAASAAGGEARGVAGASARPDVAAPGDGRTPTGWVEFRQVFVPTRVTVSCQFAFTAGDSSTLWVDDVSLRAVPRPAGLAAPPVPFEGLKRRTQKPRFQELLADEPGGYTVTCWSHDLNPKGKEGFKSPELADDAKRQAEVLATFKETGAAGLGFMDLPGRLDGDESWRTAEFHREQFRKYGVRYDVFSEGSGTTAAALKRGAELLNPSAKGLGSHPTVSLVDPAYVEAQSDILRQLAAQLRGEPFVGYYYGKDEPGVHLPEGKPERWGKYGQAMAAEVREKYGSGRFEAPLPKEPSFLKDPNRPFRWIAYNRWANDKFIETRARLGRVLHEADPGARYSPANYWFMSGFPALDYSRLSACSDLMECDPYASSAERERGRGVFNHGFGAKFMSDLTGKPVRIVAQAFDYAGYDMEPDDLREWLSQALRCGASAITYYDMDSPHWSHPDRWRMMLHLSSVISRMNRVSLPRTADTAVLYTLYTHMSQGHNSNGDQVYAAHALLGELAGSWFKFVSDAQLERAEASLAGYQAVYLPLAKYMTLEATKSIEDYVRAGGTLVCGDPEAFSFDLAGNDTAAARARLLGIKSVRPKKAAETICLTSSEWGLPAGTTLPLLPIKQEEQSGIPAFELTLADSNFEVLATYPDGAPAIVRRKVGKGRVILFASNPFAPQVTVENSSWPAAFKGLQQWLGCKVGQPIWHFALPTPKPGA